MVQFIEYIEGHLHVKVKDPHNDKMVEFSLAIEKTSLIDIDYNQMLESVDFVDCQELSEKFEELDVICPIALIIKLIQIERIYEVFWKDKIYDVTFDHY